MACDDHSQYADFWEAGQFLDAGICPFTDQLGMGLTVFMVFGSIAMAFYARDNKLAIPLVLSWVLGTVVVVNAPSVVVQATVVIIALGMTVFAYLLAQRTRAQVV